MLAGVRVALYTLQASLYRPGQNSNCDTHMVSPYRGNSNAVRTMISGWQQINNTFADILHLKATSIKACLCVTGNLIQPGFSVTKLKSNMAVTYQFMCTTS